MTRCWAVVVAFVLVACQTGAVAPPATVAAVDLEAYQGRWHELASIPNRFQSACVDQVTADYTLLADGQVRVVNRCATAAGTVEEADGRARIDPAFADPARLQVSFVELFGWPLWFGSYWIIGLDDERGYSVVGHPDRAYGWILARAPSLDPATYAAIAELLQVQGYDPCDFLLTPTSAQRFEERPRLCDRVATAPAGDRETIRG